MVKELKCWRKGLKMFPKATNSWTSKDEKTSIHINKFMGHYDVFALQEKGGGISIKQISMPTTLNKGIKSAKSYMKKHDKC